LLEFAATLPVSMKIRGRQGKQLLRRVARDLVPEKILNGPKRGFGVPLDRWFRAGLGQLARDTVADPESPVSDYIKPAVVQRLLAEHQSGRFSHGQRLWALLMLDSWFRERARGGTDVEASA
jgi:asparagine synthase (glutamine-hydrolysing)